MVRCVLGNHDLHYLAVESGQHKATKKDTFDELLKAPNRKELALWLQSLPLVYFDEKLNFAMAHAGIYPGWSIKQALSFSLEVSNCLRSSERTLFFKQMYGNEPALWQENLEGIERLRFITNAHCH